MKNIESLAIERIALGGMGIGFHQGKAIFVPYTGIGDVVEVSISLEKKDHAFGHVESFIQRGKGAIDPQCNAFGKDQECGGCDWLMVDYETQLEWKTSLVQDLFKTLLPKEQIFPIVSSPKSCNYRNKVFMPVGKDGYGIYARYSHRIVKHESCLNHPQVFDNIAQSLMELCGKAKIEAYNDVTHMGTLRHIGLRCSIDQKEILLVLVTSKSRLPFSGLIVKGITAAYPQIVGIVQNINREKTNVILGVEEKILFGRGHLYDDLADLRFTINYRSFWQINLGTMESILDVLRSFVKQSFKVIDAYCGIGAIGLSLANEISELIGIEEVPEAIEDAKKNAEQNGISNASFFCGRFEDVLPKVLLSFPADMVVLDPPRSGVDKESLHSIIKAKIPLIAYLSCSPINLKRDLQIILESGNYTLNSISSFDMFPNTWHIECLAMLSCKL